MQLLKNLSIKYKLVIVYALVSLVVFSLSFFILFSQTRDQIARHIRGELSKSNQTITDMVETAATASIKNHLRAIAEKNRDILTLLHEDCRSGRIDETEAKAQAVRLLFSQRIGKTGYIYCINSLGFAEVHPQIDIPNADLSPWPFIREQIRAKKGYLEYDWQNPGEPEPRPKALYMTYFEPWDWIISVSSYKSDFSDLLSVEDFREKILGLTFGKTGYSYLIDLRGNWVIHPEMTGNLFDTHPPEETTFLGEMIRRKSGFITYFWKNPSDPKPREKIVAFNFIPEFNWIIVSSSYTEEIFSPLKHMQRSFIIILLLTLLVTAGVSLALGTTITRPLSALVRRLESAARGDLTSRLAEDRKDEIGQLSISFNTFMHRIDQGQREIRAEINQRKETEKELDRFKTYLVDIIDSMPSILIGVDGELRVTQWNHQAEEITGLPRKKAMGKAVAQVLPGLSPHIPMIRESLTRGKIRQESKLPALSLPDANLYEDLTVYPLTRHGDRGAVIRLDEVTQKVRIEELLVQNEKMLSVGGLAAGMAHEINNPLAGVIQNAHLLTNRLTDAGIPANQKAAETAGTNMDAIKTFMDLRKIPDILKSVVGSSTRMANLVDNMLSFARKSEGSKSSCHPAELMDKTLDIASTDYDLKKHYDFRAIQVVKEYQDDLPIIHCETSKLQQVILNILNNGAQAMFEAPGDRQPAFTLKLFQDTGSHMLHLEIRDNGPGMDPQTRKRIFEPFFTTKPVGRGTGLGLSVSYFIITENHGGTLHVESEPGQGAAFIIRLPLPPESAGPEI